MNSFLGKKDLSRGIRNNNPGNLIFTNIAWQGKIPAQNNTDFQRKFEQFTTIQYGIRAMLRDVITDIKKGKNTIRKLITEYAPPNENNTDLYVQTIAKKLVLNPDSQLKKIDAVFLFNIARAIIEHENGKQNAKLVTDSHIKEAIAMLGTVSDDVLIVDTKTSNKDLLKRLLFTSILAISLFFFT
ncbi:hypothetical protein [Flavobacterium crassostreae]|uniref:Uncharacterized protein n=1 Tax=Flavobacterium crassostreae TaxID=1763534 RepID=A0A1B9EA54_9FLAO|nr:hypothetical protein [Flavobacterium crassostreae]OCB78819.1 hypothetical protein LPBF_00070 [Flavobacterium crassostreae]